MTYVVARAVDSDRLAALVGETADEAGVDENRRIDDEGVTSVVSSQRESVTRAAGRGRVERVRGRNLDPLSVDLLIRGRPFVAKLTRRRRDPQPARVVDPE